MKDNLHITMLNALINGGVDKLTQAVYESYKLPVMISDAEYNCLAHLPNELRDDPLWDSIHENGRPPLQFIRKFNDEKMMEVGAQQNTPYFLNWGFLSDHPRIIGNILVGGVIVGYLTILCDSCTKEFYDEVNLICSVFAVEFERRRIVSGNTSGAWSMFLTNLLEGRIRDEKQLKQWLRHLDRKLVGDFCVVAARPSKGEIENPLLHFIKRDIERIDQGLHPVVYVDGIYFLLVGLANLEEYRKQVALFIEKLSFIGLSFGVSNTFSEVTQIEIYRDQASFALSVCQKELTPNHLYFNDCSLQLIFKTLAEQLPSQNYIHPAMVILESYDGKNGTEYLKTLSTYISTFCNASETVQKLHIHRNTLPYRLDVIERICGIDLSDKNTCTHLLCSFQMRELM